MDRLSEIRERCDAATPGPWFNFGDWLVHTEADVEHSGIPHEKTIGSVKAQNAAFIANSISDIPYLLAQLAERDKEIERLDAELDWLQQPAKEEHDETD